MLRGHLFFASTQLWQGELFTTIICGLDFYKIVPNTNLERNENELVNSYNLETFKFK